MRVQQVSVFLENEAGRLAAVTRVLGEHGINMRALCLADTARFGILRLIVTDPEGAVKALKAEGFTTSLTDVLAVEIPDEPGGLSRVVDVLGAAGVNVEYLYAFCEKFHDNALVIIRVEDLDSAAMTLTCNGIQVIKSKDVYSL